MVTLILYFSLDLNIKTNFQIKTIISTIGYSLTCFINDFILLKIIYHLSAQSVSFLIISSAIGNCIYGIIYAIDELKQKIGEVVVFFVCELLEILIILFATLVFDEIIIINKWELDKNTKKRIGDRADEETEYDNKIDDFPLLPNSNNMNNKTD